MTPLVHLFLLVALPSLCQAGLLRLQIRLVLDQPPVFNAAVPPVTVTPVTTSEPLMFV